METLPEATDVSEDEDGNLVLSPSRKSPSAVSGLEAELDSLAELVESGNLDKIREGYQALAKRLRSSSTLAEGRPTAEEVPLAPGQFIVQRKIKKTRPKITKILYDPAYRPRWKKFLQYVGAGVSMKAAAQAIKINSDTVYVWYRRGEQAELQESKQDAPYRRFYRMVHAQLQKATAVAEATVKSENPLVWLKQGPGRVVSPEWSQPELQQVELIQTGPVQETLPVPQADILAALKELQAAGIENLGQIVEGQFAVKDESDAEYEEGSGDKVSSRGTNYMEDGNWRSHNPSLPAALRPAPVPGLPAPSLNLDPFIPEQLPPPHVPVPVDMAMHDATGGELNRPLNPGSPSTPALDKILRMMRR